MTINKYRKVYVSKIRNVKKEGYKKLPARLKHILPVVFMLQDAEYLSPSEIIDKISLLTSNKSKYFLNEMQRNELKKYLEKYGYEFLWVEE